MTARRVSPIQRNLLYEEAGKRIRELIEKEGLRGSYLASERELAGMFGVSRETVRKGLDNFDIGSKKEFKELKARVENLEKQIAMREEASGKEQE